MLSSSAISFSRIERTSEGDYVAHCSAGGCIKDPTKAGAQRQVDYWLANPNEYLDGIAKWNAR